ncbi:MAG: putative O-glycosylation ligase, exosortase A system-associated [Burkholderiaceae bacterium]
MGLRDIAVFVILGGLLPLSFTRPRVAAIVFIILGVLAPHRLTFGSAATVPWVAIYFVPLIIGALNGPSGNIKSVISATWPVWLFVLMTTLTTIFAMDIGVSAYRYGEFLKILLGATLVFSVLRNHDDIGAVVAAFAGSMAFLGLKAAPYTLLGSDGHVLGPTGTAIEDNNHMAVALIMSVPLLYWLSRVHQRWIVRQGLIIAMGATLVSALGTYSRGGFIALVAMLSCFLFRAKRKLLILIVIGAMSAVVFEFMPQRFRDRIETINDYQQDSSAQSRFGVWETALNIAEHRMLGAGFEYYRNPENFFQYSRVTDGVVRATHSIYFQTLGEHGFPGLIIYFLMFGKAFLSLRRAERMARNRREPVMAELARMVQVSLISFCVGAAFLSMTYWEGLYYLIFLSFVFPAMLERKLESKLPKPAQSSQRELKQA